MIEVNISIDGVEEVTRGIERVMAKVEDLSDVWPDVRDEFYAIEDERFASEGDGTWAPLSPKYAEWKAAHYGGMPILQATGALLESMTGGNTTVEMGSLDMTITPNNSYAAYHQYGTSRMPARPPIDINDEARTRMLQVIARYIVEVTREEFSS